MPTTFEEWYQKEPLKVKLFFHHEQIKLEIIEEFHRVMQEKHIYVADIAERLDYRLHEDRIDMILSGDHTISSEEIAQIAYVLHKKPVFKLVDKT